MYTYVYIYICMYGTCSYSLYVYHGLKTANTIRYDTISAQQVTITILSEECDLGQLAISKC